MADTNISTILSLCATTSSKIKDLVIKDGQLIFVHDSKKIALDFGGKRTFFNQITELASEDERTSILAPITGHYYFVVKTAVLWTYQNGWVQLTTPPEEILFIGTDETDFPTLGSAKGLYVNKKKKEISVWDEETNKYLVVANKEEIESISEEKISSLFI